MKRRRVVRYAGLVLALLAVFLVWFLRRPKSSTKVEPPSEALAFSSPGWSLVPPANIGELEAHRHHDKNKVGLWMLSDPKLPVVVADALIMGRFPPNSLPLHADMTELMQPNGRSDTRMAMHRKDGSDDPTMQVLFTGDRFRMFGDQELNATLEVFKGDQRVPITISSALARNVEPNTRKPLGIDMTINLTDDGTQVYHTRFKAAGTPLAKHFGFIQLEVEYDAGDHNPSTSMLDIFYQPEDQTPARYTGSFHEQLENGSLVIYIGIEVFQPGRYILEANLFDSTGRPAVALLERPDLAPGRQEIPFTAFGRAIREQGSVPPFTLANLRGNLVLMSQDPDRKLMPDYPSEYHTANYRIDDFSGDEYWTPGKETQVRRMIADSQNSGMPMSRTTLGEARQQGWKPSW